MSWFVASLLTIVALSLVHAYSGTVSALRRVWGHRLLSIAGGISVTYVYLELIPGLIQHQHAIEQTGLLASLERHVYVCALFGLVVAYAVEVLTRRSRRGNAREDGTPGHTTLGGYRLSITSFAVYNAAVGYAVADPADLSVRPHWLFTIAMGLHFAVNDHALAVHHGARYQVGRWLLVGGLVAGWLVGVIPSLQIPPSALALVLAYIAGGTVMNIVRHELPDAETQSDVLAFVSAVVLYGALTLWMVPAGH